MWHRSKLLWQFYAGQRWLIWLTVVVSLFAGLLTISVPVAIGKYYDFLFGYHSYRARLLEFLPIELDAMPVFLMFFFGLVLFRTLFNFLERYCIGLLGERLVFNLRELLFQHQLKIPLSDYEGKGAGRYLLRFSGDLSSLRRLFTHGIIRFISDIILVTLSLVLLFVLDAMLGLFMLAGLFLPLLILLLLNRRLSRRTREQRNRKSSLLAFTSVRLQTISTIQFFNKEATEERKFLQHARQAMDSGIAYQKMTSLIGALIPGLLYFLLAAVFSYAYFRSAPGFSAAGNLLIFVMLLLTILPVFRRLLQVNVVWELGKISLEKLLKVLNRAATEAADLPDLKVKKGEIRVTDLCFGFRTQKEVFDHLTLQIPPKALSLIDSRAGAGKSTLIKLLCGLYLPEKGQISIDGQNTAAVRIKSLRRHIAVVTEDAPLLGKTVFEAISYSRKADRKRPARELLDYLFAHNPDIPRLALHDPIGDLGCQLSKGQRKVLFYARAMLTRKPILLIDEPLEGFAPSSFPFWVQELQTLAADMTVVVFSSQDYGDLFKSGSIHRINLPEPAGEAGRKPAGTV